MVVSKPNLAMVIGCVLLTGIAIGFYGKGLRVEVKPQSAEVNPLPEKIDPEKRPRVVMIDGDKMYDVVTALAETSDRQAFLKGIEDLRKSLGPDDIRIVRLELTAASWLKDKFQDIEGAKAISLEMARLSDRLIAETATLRCETYNYRADLLKRTENDHTEYTACKLRAIESFEQLDAYYLLGTMLPDKRELYESCRSKYTDAVIELARDSEEQFLQIKWVDECVIPRLKINCPQMVDKLPVMASHSAWRLQSVKNLRSIIESGKDEYGPVEDEILEAVKVVERYLSEVISKNSRRARRFAPPTRSQIAPPVATENDVLKNEEIEKALEGLRESLRTPY
ncbi:MAG: hypothetical protein U0941_20455 [Planctomycetaceae bacterium]